MISPQKAQSPAATGQSADQTDDALIVAETVALRKRLATIKARFAIAGFVVHECTVGGFLVARPGLSRYCVDIDGLEAFLGQVERGQR